MRLLADNGVTVALPPAKDVLEIRPGLHEVLPVKRPKIHSTGRKKHTRHGAHRSREAGPPSWPGDTSSRISSGATAASGAPPPGQPPQSTAQSKLWTQGAGNKLKMLATKRWLWPWRPRVLHVEPQRCCLPRCPGRTRTSVPWAPSPQRAHMFRCHTNHESTACAYIATACKVRVRFLLRGLGLSWARRRRASWDQVVHVCHGRRCLGLWCCNVGPFTRRSPWLDRRGLGQGLGVLLALCLLWAQVTGDFCNCNTYACMYCLPRRLVRPLEDSVALHQQGLFSLLCRARRQPCLSSAQMFIMPCCMFLVIHTCRDTSIVVERPSQPHGSRPIAPPGPFCAA